MSRSPVSEVSSSATPGADGSTVINESQVFSWILIAVIVLLFASFLVWMAAGLLIGDPTTSQADTETGASWTFFTVLGAFTGLLAAKLT
jgi:hypothetical protein